MEQNLLKTVNLEFPYHGQMRHFSLQLDLNEYSQKAMWVYFTQGKLYEPETSNLFCALLQAGDRVIDVGGHIGYFSLLAAAIVGEQGQVFTFEPEISNFKHLQQNISNNQFSQISSFPWAVGETEDEVTFYINEDNDGGHALWDVSKHDFNQKSRIHMDKRIVRQTTLLKALENEIVTPLKLIKMDVEGCEPMVIRGARELLVAQKHPFVIAEINRFAMDQMSVSEPEFRELMESMGYQAYFPQENGLTFVESGTYVDVNYVFNLFFAIPQRLDEMRQNNDLLVR